MDGVGIPIIERPRPLPGHDTPNPTQHTYTLKCEEPFISANGDAFAVDVTSGQGRYLFSIPSRSRDHSTVFQVTETGVYALEDRGDDRVVTLFYRPWDGEEQRELFTTSDLGCYLKGTALTGQLDIQSFALRPGWDGGAQQ